MTSLLTIDTSKFSTFSPENWAKVISQTWRVSVDAIIMTGKLLSEAKKALPHGTFTTMVEEHLGFGARMAQKLMAIGADGWIANPKHASALPARWDTLYELTRIPEEKRDAQLAAGVIRPDMERGEVIKNRLEVRRIERNGEMRDLAANPLALPCGPFAAGIADPPWENPDSGIGFSDRHYRNQYPTMSPAEIAAMPVAEIFAPTAFLALWITRHMLAIGAHIPVLQAWGFNPNTTCTWDKEWIGLGNGYVRDRCEHVILATRGKPAVPSNPSDRPDSIFAERRSNKHSEKPARVHDWIETWFPQMSYVELFARPKPRAGWVFWGNHATIEIDAEAVKSPSDSGLLPENWRAAARAVNIDVEIPGKFHRGAGFWAEPL